MRKMVAAVAVLVALTAGTADAGEPHHLIHAGVNTAPRPLDYLGVHPTPSGTRLQPVVGSVRRSGHFTNPFTHKAKYTQMVYNPLTGHFGKMKFRR